MSLYLYTLKGSLPTFAEAPALHRVSRGGASRWSKAYGSFASHSGPVYPVGPAWRFFRTKN